MTESNQGPATPGTAARCETCNRDLAAEPHDAFDAQCSRDGIERLKAENASLLESLREAQEAIRLRDANDNGLFMEAFRARERAREAEQNYAGAKELIEAGKTDYRSLLAQARAAEQHLAVVTRERDHAQMVEVPAAYEAIAAAEQRAEAAEKERDDARRAANTAATEAANWRAMAGRNEIGIELLGDRADKAESALAAAEQRNTTLEGALRDGAVRGTIHCAHCGNPATCFGRYERCEGPVQFACDTCCGHGNEDGWCERIAPEDDEARAALHDEERSAQTGECVGHLGSPSNTAMPHPKKTTCFNWKPLAATAQGEEK